MSAELERAQRRVDQAKARLQMAQAKERHRERRLDARRKIIIGGAMISLIASQPADKRNRVVQALLRHIAGKDLALVEPLLTTGATTGDVA